ncbi:uncharacterized protein LOC141628364 [Silene latifolia]|uniref:uncharacterized protein LOC141628364 n=1 Tax=Silene latifolia TaxID=37657 RepID=UPI003D77638F
MRQFNSTVKRIRSDNGTEFKPLIPYFREQGIIFETSMVKTPQQNARVERKHRHLLNVARALRFQSSLPTKFWGECVLTAAHLINRTPSRILHGKTPFELLFGKPANLELLRVFGCLAYAKNVNPTDKFDSRSRKCVFLGYPFGKKGWTLFDLESGKYFHSRDVSFIEEIFPYSKEAEVGSNVSNDDTVFVDEEFVVPDVEPVFTGPGSRLGDSGSGVTSSEDAGVVVPSSDQHSSTAAGGAVTGERENSGHVLDALEDCIVTTHSDSAPVISGSEMNNAGGSIAANLGRGKREKIPNKNHKDYVKWDCIDTVFDESPTTANSVSGSSYPLSHFVKYDKFSQPHRHFLAAITRDIEPRSFKEAMGDARWRKAMSEEIIALESNKTWSQ